MLLSQIFGIIALILAVISVQYIDKTKLLFLQTLTNVFKILSLAFVGGLGGAYSQFVGLLRKMWFYKNSKNHKENGLASLIFFCALVVVVTIFTWDGYISLLPMFGIIFGTYGIWQDDPFILRYFTLIGAAFFTVYGVMVLAYTNALSELFEVVSIGISLIRFRYIEINGQPKRKHPTQIVEKQKPKINK